MGFNCQIENDNIDWLRNILGASATYWFVQILLNLGCCDLYGHDCKQQLNLTNCVTFALPNLFIVSTCKCLISRMELDKWSIISP